MRFEVFGDKYLSYEFYVLEEYDTGKFFVVVEMVTIF